MSIARPEIKIGDVGTVYFVPTYDNDLEPANFNPTGAAVLQIVFKMPGTAPLITRTATAAQKTIAGVSVWGLQYTVTAADVAAWSSDTVGGFHQAAGYLDMEGYVQFSSAQKWASGTIKYDQQDRRLQVVARLAA